MSRRTDPMRNLQVQNSAARRDAAEAKAAAKPEAATPESTPQMAELPIDNEALTIAVRATLEQRKTRKRAAAVTTTPEPDRSLDQLMATYGRSKPRKSKSPTEE